MGDIRDFLAFCLLVHGPAWLHDPNHAFGRWILATAGNWAYRDERKAAEADRTFGNS